MAESKRRSTKFPGVQARESIARRYKGRPDVCYTIDYRDATGKRVRRDVGWASEGYSAALASELRARLVQEAKTAALTGMAPIKRVPVLTLREAWAIYLKDWLIARGKKYSSDSYLFEAHLGGLAPLPLNEITAYVLEAQIAALRRQGLSDQTIVHIIGLVRRIMRRMMKWKLYVGPDPFADVELPRVNNARERALTPEEAQSLLAAVKARSVKTWMMALISLHCGLRFSEITALRAGDVDFAGGLLYVAESKNGKARHAVMTEQVAAALSSLPPRPSDALLFPARGGGLMTAVPDTFARAVADVGLNDTGEVITHADGRVQRLTIQDRRKRIVFHSLRHTYATLLARLQQSQSAIADLLGHKSLEMSRRYTHLMEDSRRAVAQGIEAQLTHGVPPEKNQ